MENYRYGNLLSFVCADQKVLSVHNEITERLGSKISSTQSAKTRTQSDSSVSIISKINYELMLSMRLLVKLKY